MMRKTLYIKRYDQYNMTKSFWGVKSPDPRWKYPQQGISDFPGTSPAKNLISSDRTFFPKNHVQKYQKTYGPDGNPHTKSDNFFFHRWNPLFPPWKNYFFQTYKYMSVFSFTFAYIWKTQFVKVITYHIIASHPGKFDMGSPEPC